MYTHFCKRAKCPHYIEWDFGYGICHSCKLQGQSYYVENIAEKCPYKDQFQQEVNQVLSKINLCLINKKDEDKVFLGNKKDFIYIDINEDNPNQFPECCFVNYIDKDNIIKYGHSHAEWKESLDKLQPIIIKLDLSTNLKSQEGKTHINNFKTFFFEDKKGILINLF